MLYTRTYSAPVPTGYTQAPNKGQKILLSTLTNIGAFLYNVALYFPEFFTFSRVHRIRKWKVYFSKNQLWLLDFTPLLVLQNPGHREAQFLWELVSGIS